MIDIDAFGTTVSNSGLLVQLDGEWFVDFDELGASLDVEVSAVVNAPANSTTPARVALWASPSQGNTGGSGVKLAEVTMPLAGTGGLDVGYVISAKVANPTGKKYLALISTPGDT